MKIAILQVGTVPTELQIDDYDVLFSNMLIGTGHECETFKVFDMHFPVAVESFSGYIITGSAHGAYERLDWMIKLEDFIREIANSDSLLLGVCFGHQIIAMALGGKAEKFDGGISVGLCEYEIDGKLMQSLAWHQDQVVQTPKNAQVIGSSDFCKNAVMKYGNNILTYQFHPEFTTETLLGLLSVREEKLGSEIVQKAKKSIEYAEFDESKLSQEVIQMAKDFFEQKNKVN